MGYEVKDTATKSPLRPWDVWKDGRCVAPGFSTKSSALIEQEVLEGLDKLRALKQSQASAK